MSLEGYDKLADNEVSLDTQESLNNEINEFKNEESQLQAEVQQSGPKGNNEAKDFIKKGYISLVANYLDNYKGLDSEVADALIKNGYIESVKSHLNSFVCDKNLAIVLVKNKNGKFVAENLKFFTDVTVNEIVNLCIEYKYEQPDIMLIFHDLLSNKNNIFDKNVAKNLIEAGELGEMVKNLKSFEGLDKEIAKNLIEAGELGEMVKNLKSFEGLDKEIAEILIEAGELGEMAKNLKSFEGLDKEIVEILIKEGYLKNVVENKDTFDQEGKEYIYRL